MLQESIARFLLKRKKPTSSKRGYVGWKSVRNVLIVGVLDEKWDLKAWKSWYSLINSKDRPLDVLLFDPKLEEAHGKHPYFKIFGKKALNIFSQPKGDWIRPYLSKDYDLLFCLTEEPDLTIQYICSRAHSDCRVGSFDDSFSSFDLVLMRPENMGSKSYCSEMLHYLQQINTA